MRAGFRTRQLRLVTTLLDAEENPPRTLANPYRWRWQVELHFHQIKIGLGLERRVVRCSEMIARALAMHLVAYPLIRGLMQEAAQVRDVPLERISFKGQWWRARQYGQMLLGRAAARGVRRCWPSCCGWWPPLRCGSGRGGMNCGCSSAARRGLGGWRAADLGRSRA